jgi:hypothetical protein
MTFDLTRDEIWFLKALRAAGERGRIVSAPASRAGLNHLVEVQYVMEHPQSEPASPSEYATVDEDVSSRGCPLWVKSGHGIAAH